MYIIKNQVLTDFPHDLKKKLIQSANKPFLESITYFKLNFSNDFLDNLSL